jgi:hypothetical protein
MTAPGPKILLAICAGLVMLGILTILDSPGLFVSLLGASISGIGGMAAYLISSR